VYKGKALLFCDGPAHDAPEQKLRDIEKREPMREQGQRIVIYKYTDDLQSFVDSKPDLFIKVN